MLCANNAPELAELAELHLSKRGGSADTPRLKLFQGLLWANPRVVPHADNGIAHARVHSAICMDETRIYSNHVDSRANVWFGYQFAHRLQFTCLYILAGNAAPFLRISLKTLAPPPPDTHTFRYRRKSLELAPARWLRNFQRA